MAVIQKTLRLSELVETIRDVIDLRFAGEIFWIATEVTDVKKYPDKRWCFLKFVEKEGAAIVSEARGVFWSNAWHSIERFEKLTGRPFQSGISITCGVCVRFHKRYGLSLEVQDIDYAFTLGKMELEKQQTLEKLVTEHPDMVRLVDGRYLTHNNQKPLPPVFRRIALVTAPGSDGQRDFRKELENNDYGYAFRIDEYLTRIQGDEAPALLCDQLEAIAGGKEQYDAVAIVRGGGSQTDLSPFDDYALALSVASFPVPVFTGIGHDRNISITDLMARAMKTPTKAAAYFVERNLAFEQSVIELKERLDRAAGDLIERARQNLAQVKRVLKNAHPDTVLRRGFAIVTFRDRIITDPALIQEGMSIRTLLRDHQIASTVTGKTKNEKGLDF